MPRALVLLMVFWVALPIAKASASPRETAEAFLRYIVGMEVHQATLLVSEPDRSAPSPLGRYYSFLSSPPRFPSRWRVEVAFVEEREGAATVGLSIVHPEIEDSLRRVSSAALEALALQQYFARELEMTRTEIEVSLVETHAGQWGVVTFADLDDWLRQNRNFPAADVTAINREEIVRFRDQLLERFPHRNDEIFELVEPRLAILDAAEGLALSGQSVIDDRTREQRRFYEPAYDVRLNLTNGSFHTITRLDGQLVFRDALGAIIDSAGWILDDRDLPAGLGPGETFSYASGIRIQNLDAVVASVELQVRGLTLR